MIRYLLKIPRQTVERPDRPHRFVQVSIQANTPDQSAKIEFEGDQKDVTLVREALFRWAAGDLGRPLEEESTPRDLAVAMHRPVMEKYEPQRVEGSNMFIPAQMAAADELDQFVKVVTRLLAVTLPKLPSYDASARAELLEEIQIILVRGRALIESGQSSSIDSEIFSFASLLNNQLKLIGIDCDQIRAILHETLNLLETTEFQAPQTPKQVAFVLQCLVDVVESPKTFDLKQLIEKMESQWTSSNVAK